MPSSFTCRPQEEPRSETQPSEQAQMQYVPNTSWLLRGSTNAFRLTSIQCRGEMLDLFAKITLVHTYIAKQNERETVYQFPIDAAAAITSLEIHLGPKLLRAELRERNEAKRQYDNAMRQNKTTALMTQETDDVFTMSLGHVPKDTIVQCVLTYCTPLALEGPNARFPLPAYIAPRYHAREGKAPTSEILTYRANVSVNVRVHPETSLVTVTSPTHPNIVVEQRSPTHATVQWTQDACEGFRDDFVLFCENSDPFADRALLALHRKSLALLLTCCRPPTSDLSAGAMELLFLADVSGSMRDKRPALQKTLHLFLSSLPASARFNVISFQSSYQKLFPHSKPYNDETLMEAKGFVDQLITQGGTELLRPLRDLLQQPPIEGYARQLFVLTDGEVSNVDEIVQTIRRDGGTTRVFTFGLGRTVCRHLCLAMARAGRGECEFVGDANNLAGKVVAALSRALQPAELGTSIDWSNYAEGQVVEQCPNQMPNFYPGSRTFVFGLRELREVNEETVARLRSVAAYNVRMAATRLDGSLLEFCVPVQPAQLEETDLLHTLYARAQLLEWSDDGDSEHRAKMIALSLRYGVLCQFTGYVVVDEEGAEVPTARVSMQQPPTEPSGGVPVAIVDTMTFGCAPEANPVGWRRGNTPVVDTSVGWSARTVDRSAGWSACSSGVMPVANHFRRSPERRSNRTSRRFPRRSSANRAKTATTTRDTFASLIALAPWNGLWNLDKMLALNTSWRVIVDKMPAKLPRTLRGTLLVLWLFQHAYADRSQQWALMAKKARSAMLAHTTMDIEAMLLSLSFEGL